MSGALAIAPILSAVICLVGWRMLRWLLKGNPYRELRGLGCVCIALLYPFICVGVFYGSFAVTTEQGLSVTPSEANRSLMLIDVPPQATNVDFRHSFFSGLTDAAEFTLSESDFLAWMKSQG